jgi:5-methylcytosine-specific restriction protein A
MPMRPKKVCGYQYCHALAASGDRYCRKHKSRETGWGRTQAAKGSDTERGYGWQWRKLRLTILERDRHLCMNHLNNLGKFVPATEVDHIVNRAAGGSDEPSNLISTCSDCHRVKTERERTA